MGLPTSEFRLPSPRYEEGVRIYGIFYIGLSLASVGLAVLLLFASAAVTKAIARLTAIIARGAVSPLRRKGA